MFIDRKPLAIFAGIVCFVAAAAAAAQTKSVRIGMADTLSAENLVEAIAFANAEKRGVQVKLIPLKSDDITFQAVVGDEIDIGIGDAYKMIHTLKAPIRHFYQLRRLGYFPVVNKEFYKSWKDLDGHDMVVHSRGSGTEALARLMEKVHGIKYAQVSYVPGSQVRAVAMERGNIKVTYLDLANTRRLTTGPMASKFMVLPAGGQSASDEILYATKDYIAANQDVIQVLLEEILKATRAVNADYRVADRERERLGLLKDLPPKMIEETNPYFEQAVAAGLFPNDGGGESAARADLEFLILAGRLQGKASDMNLADFWDFGPLEKARAALGPAK